MHNVFRILPWLILGVTVPAWAVPAFPGAEGAGANAAGGRGGRVIYVTTLDDNGPGSLRDAIGQEGPRTVLFRVSGIIDLKEDLKIGKGQLTVAGQTAPGDGICLRGGGVGLEANDVILRYIRFRPGDVAGHELDGLSVSDSHNVIVDHCSVSWAVDEGLTVTGTSDAVSVQWCIVAESLHRSVHKKGPHSMGSLIRSHGGTYSFHHNLYAHNNTRNPRPGDNYDKAQGVLLDWRNNVIYDWGGACGYGVKEDYRLNYVNDFLKPGPSTSAKERQIAFHIGGPANRVYIGGTVMDGYTDADANNALLLAFDKDLTDSDRAATVVPAAFDVPAVETQPAKDARDRVLEKVGATLSKRDAVDTRIVATVRDSSGKIIDSQNEVGGWPAYTAAEAPTDRDNDGMPDTWETAHNLDPNNPADGPQDANGDGYTNLEDYLNTPR